jgi:hypothetical protein
MTRLQIWLDPWRRERLMRHAKIALSIAPVVAIVLLFALRATP